MAGVEAWEGSAMASPAAERGAALPALGPHGQRALIAQASLPWSVMGVVVFQRCSLCLCLPDFSILALGPRQVNRARANTSD